MSYFSIVLNQIEIFVIYALIGVIAIRTGVMNEKGLHMLSRLLMKITLPVMIFTNTINGATREQFIHALPVLFVTVLMYLFLYVLCLILSKPFGLNANDQLVFRASTTFGNVGFMGIPIVAALFPEEGMLYIALFTVVDQLLLWTLGVKLTSPAEEFEGLSPSQIAKKMVNPATVGICLAVLGILLNLKLPELLDTALTRTGAASTPLGMIYLGGLFYSSHLGQYLRHKEIYVAIVCKMCIFPVIFFYLVRMIPGVSQEIAITMGVLSALPTMSTIPMLADSQKSNGEYAAGIIFVTTLFSIITMPAVCLLMR